jgi:hypothetical protein
VRGHEHLQQLRELLQAMLMMQNECIQQPHLLRASTQLFTRAMLAVRLELDCVHSVEPATVQAEGVTAVRRGLLRL